MKKRTLPSDIQYADLDRLEGRNKYTKEWIEKRIRDQKELTYKEIKGLDPELKKYYNDLRNQFNNH